MTPEDPRLYMEVSRHTSRQRRRTPGYCSSFMIYSIMSECGIVCREICTEQSRFLMTARCDSFPKRQLVGHWIADIKRDFEVIKEN